MKIIKFHLSLCALALLAGCAAYSWRSTVPEEMRTVAVPVFRNETNVTGLGSEITKQVLREFEREGTFKICRAGESAVEVQGIVKHSKSDAVAYGRSVGARNREYRMEVMAIVSFIDKKTGKVLVDNRPYKTDVTFLAGDDIMTGERDASARLAEELARSIVDDVLSLNWDY